jgi:hypothetical protein
MELRHWACQYLLAITILLALSGFAPAMAQPDDLAALNRQIGQLYQASRYDEAIPLAQRLVELSGTRFGKESREHANALAVLGDLYREKGWYAEAEPLYQSVRDKLEKALGHNHREVGQSLNRLGNATIGLSGEISNVQIDIQLMRTVRTSTVGCGRGDGEQSYACRGVRARRSCIPCGLRPTVCYAAGRRHYSHQRRYRSDLRFVGARTAGHAPRRGRNGEERLRQVYHPKRTIRFPQRHPWRDPGAHASGTYGPYGGGFSATGPQTIRNNRYQTEVYIKMFKAGDPQGANAVDARALLKTASKG